MSLLHDSSFEMFDSESSLEQFVINVPIITTTFDGQSVKDIFDGQPDVEGIVVMESGNPAGIIMRTTFFQKTGTLYGHSLYMHRPVRIFMDTDFMKVDTTENVSKIGIHAMDREQCKLYDYIVVYKNKVYLGVISIRLFLVELSKKNEAQISVLKNQQQKLLSAHEQEIQLRKNLEYQSASVRNLLDNADQGFLWFGSDLMIKSEYSYKCMSIFNASIGNLTFPDFVTQYFGDDKTVVFKMAFDSYFKNNSSVTDNVYLMLLPSDCLIQGKNIHFQYRKIESNGQKAIMVILNDITEKVSLERVMEDDRNKQRLLIKAFGCQAQIKQMLDEFREIFSGGYRNYFQERSNFNNNLNEFFRAVHTFKGDFAQYGFLNASNYLHEFESDLLALVERGEKSTIIDVESIMAKADPEKMLNDDMSIILDVLGDSYFDQCEMISFSKSKLQKIEEAIKNISGPLDSVAVIHLLESLKRKNIKIFLEQYRDYLEYLSGRLMKNMPVYLVEGDDVEIDGDEFGNFIKSLVHVFRNIMDHGIESDEERLKYGKAENGLVECKISLIGNDQFVLRISDDGRGIDLEKLKKKLIENHFHSADELSRLSKNEIANLIIVDHLSTKDSPDALSGRGMGMSAFQSACLALGGKVEIATDENKGTTFLITLPYYN